MNKNIGALIIELRKKNNLTQSDLAKQLNITDKTISRWERGINFPDMNFIDKMANIFGVEISYMLGLENDKGNTKRNEDDIINIVFLCISVGLGIATFVLNVLDKISVKDSIIMLSLGLICISLSKLNSLKKFFK